MPGLRRAILTSLCVLTVLAILGLVSSWFQPLSFDIQITQHTNLSVHSYNGRIQLNHTYQNDPVITVPPTRELSHEEAMAILDKLVGGDARTKIGSGEITGIPTEPPHAWLMFEYQTHELPALWLGGGVMRSLHIPYWFLVLLFGACPIYFFIRRARGIAKEHVA